MIELGKDVEIVYPFRPHKIGMDELDKMASQLVMIVRPTVQLDLEYRLKNNFNDGCFIYSQWEEYKTKPGQIKDFIDFIASKGMPIKDIHTSGHADLFGLKRMVEAVTPKNIVPIHTFKAERYEELFTGTNIRRVSDLETVEI
jgi:ribonuclease J